MLVSAVPLSIEGLGMVICRSHSLAGATGSFVHRSPAVSVDHRHPCAAHPLAKMPNPDFPPARLHRLPLASCVHHRQVCAACHLYVTLPASSSTPIYPIAGLCVAACCIYCHASCTADVLPRAARLHSVEAESFQAVLKHVGHGAGSDGQCV